MLNNVVEETKAAFSIDLTEDGRKVAVLDYDILEGVPKKDWKNAVSDELKKNSPIFVKSGEIVIGSKDRKEFLNSRYSNWLKHLFLLAKMDILLKL